MAEPISGVMNQQAVSSPQPLSNNNTLSERPLAEFLAEARTNTMSKGAASALANPAALSGELVKKLHGFFERSASFDKLRKGGGANMEQKEIQLASLTEEVQEERVHSGPARESLLPAERTRERTDPAVTLEEISKLSDMMNKMMGFAAELHFVSTAVSNVTGSVRTLTRGQ